MTVLTTSAGQLAARSTSRAAGFRVELMRDWQQAVARWHDISPSTPFQHPQWYDAWYGAFAAAEGVAPLIAVVTDASTGEPAVLLPLIRRQQDNVAIVEFADLNLTDYNAPIIGAAAPRDAKAARALWRSLLSALRRMPDRGDLIRLRKVPVDLDGKPNPLALLNAAGPCLLNGNLVTTGEDYEAWRYTLEKTVRKELERSWRVFTRDPAASFAIITDRDESLRVLSTTEVQQGTRMQSLGRNYVLNDETCAAFYRNLVRDGVGNGYALVTVLAVGDEIVATLLGIRTGPRYVMIRISNAGEKWSNCSPGRLIIERTMAALHRDGVREFDFSVGNYAYKRRFGVTRRPLVDISAALSWRGWPFALRDCAVGTLRNHPKLDARLRRMFDKPLSHEEN
ncbi:GNAT family N-acetyltransferase [Bradyrhizobium sp. AUGA SZCCT0283]|uniref:GNAT family N-acetyltransferase n=1 Tax=Bradyrhizobium sp. AUGA SZCCT0283 TaxID=2807671 RepID=UPI001BAC16BA|nr:GNAT family N-acetyltransferase [Bradyrhizobium sp. AUGA SZCCT0283]MBR1274188.1 GNAT family N-acetyltransferase [Bradyrhizobium sp. AUGA SZCCT0283]